MIEEKKINKTDISEFGEVGLIKHLTQNFKINNNTTKVSIGDDAAILEFVNEQVVVTSDILIEGIHFNLGYSPLKHLGYKAVVVNLSDVYAMNAKPSQIVVNIAVSNRFPVEALEDIYDGIHQACSYYDVDLVGGDTSSSTSGLVISITAIGHAKPEKIVQRNGAKEKDIIVVTGDLGAAYMGLHVLERENLAFKSNPNLQPDISRYQYILERQLKPEARKDVFLFLEENNIIPTSMIDISDGISSELKHLSLASNIGFQIYENKIPIDPMVISTCEEFNINPTTAALDGGEDYELMFTISISDVEKLKDNPNFTMIGHAVDNGNKCVLVTSGTEEFVEIKSQGWDAFEKKM